MDLIERRIVIPGRDPARPPLRIAFASDLHLGPTTPTGVLDNAFALLRAAKPDVLALGGDYVFLGATHDKVRELNNRVTAVDAPIKVAVLGNHDFWARPARLEVALAARAHRAGERGHAPAPAARRRGPHRARRSLHLGGPARR